MHLEILNSVFQSISAISLPFILYIAFQVGKIVQNIHDINYRVNQLEKKLQHQRL